jgi:RND family efflux transporter MFP subunit
MKTAAIFIVPIVSALLLGGCSHQKGKRPQPVEVVRDVQLVEVQRKAVPDYVEAVGTVRALQTSQLSAQVVGGIVSIPVHEGQQVRKGDVLVILDDAQQRAMLERASATVAAAQQDIAAADADYGLANTTLARYQTLYEKKSVSPHEMDEIQARAKLATARRDQAQAGITQARAMEAQARAGLSFTRIRAPFTGVITAKHVDSGSLASPGVPLLTIEDTQRFRVEASVDEGDIRLVSIGATAPVLVDAIGAEFEGKVVQIIPAADPATRSFVVKVELPSDQRLHSGLFTRVHFRKGERLAVLLPRASVFDRGQLQAVYVVAPNQIANVRFVSLGKSSGEYVEALSGLEGGERVVLSPGERELSGKRIEGQL